MASVDEAVDIIRETPISSIINFYHPIRKKGSNYEGVCPFHGDKHPSMKVNDQKKIYKCFACGAGGDAIKFSMDFQNLSFIDAVKDIASKLGIHIDEMVKKNKNPKFEMGLRVLTAANKLYKKYAIETNPELYKNFIKQRNLNEQSIKDFEIGFAPGNNVLLNYLSSINNEEEKNFALQTAMSIGLIRESNNSSGHYDFYRERVIFPIWDHSGNVRGFSSRAVKENQKPKYLNSGESFIFDKGNTLYGFKLAKKNIRESDVVLIAEGNMDVVVLHQYGFSYSVGTMGVSLSENSVKLLSNMTKNIVLGMDSDNAGIKAMERISESFFKAGIIPKFLDYSPAKDPDDFLQEFGRLELIKRIDEAPSCLDFRINQIINEKNPNTLHQKLDTLNSIFAIVAPLKENLFATEKIIETAKKLQLNSSSEDIINNYKEFLSNINNIEKRQNSFKAKNTPEEAPPQKFRKEVEQQVPSLEENLLPISITEAQTLEKILIHPQLVLSDKISEILDFIGNNEVKRIITWLKKIYLEIDESDYEYLLKKQLELGFDSKINDVITSALFKFEKLQLEQKIEEKLIKDLSLKLHSDQLVAKRQSLKQSLKSASNESASLEILREIQAVETQLRKIKFNS